MSMRVIYSVGGSLFKHSTWLLQGVILLQTSIALGTGISGTVIGGNGNPISTTVLLVSADDPTDVRLSRSGENGTYAFEDVQEREHVIVVPSIEESNGLLYVYPVVNVPSTGTNADIIPSQPLYTWSIVATEQSSGGTRDVEMRVMPVSVPLYMLLSSAFMKAEFSESRRWGAYHKDPATKAEYFRNIIHNEPFRITIQESEESTPQSFQTIFFVDGTATIEPYGEALLQHMGLELGFTMIGQTARPQSDE